MQLDVESLCREMHARQTDGHEQQVLHVVAFVAVVLGLYVMVKYCYSSGHPVAFAPVGG